MQELSYDFTNAKFNIGQLIISVEIFSYENVYYLDPESIDHQVNTHTEIISCNSFTWAGGQEIIPGNAHINIQKEDDIYRIGIRVNMQKKIRCIKLIVENLPKGDIVNLRSENLSKIPDEGIILNYPEGWRELSTSLLMIETAGSSHYYVRSTDDKVREKRMVILPKSNTFTVELIWEEDATKQLNCCSVPYWEFGFYTSAEKIFETKLNFCECITCHRTGE